MSGAIVCGLRRIIISLDDRAITSFCTIPIEVEGIVIKLIILLT
ncbi:hypothetical protein [Borrelia coriaceae]|nr:hypothetical protein [Borrelia coriaceae]